MLAWAANAEPPPGDQATSPLHNLLEVHQRALAEYHSHHYISATVSVDSQGRVAALETETDYNQGLLEGRDEADLLTISTAVCTLEGVGLRVGPLEIRAADVRLQKAASG